MHSPSLFLSFPADSSGDKVWCGFFSTLRTSPLCPPVMGPPRVGHFEENGNSVLHYNPLHAHSFVFPRIFSLMYYVPALSLLPPLSLLALKFSRLLPASSWALLIKERPLAWWWKAPRPRKRMLERRIFHLTCFPSLWCGISDVTQVVCFILFQDYFFLKYE